MVGWLIITWGGRDIRVDPVVGLGRSHQTPVVHIDNLAQDIPSKGHLAIITINHTFKTIL